MVRILFLTFALLLGWMNAGLAVTVDKPDIYKLRQGDTVLISVWREDALQKQVVPDGSITPLGRQG